MLPEEGLGLGPGPGPSARSPLQVQTGVLRLVAGEKTVGEETYTLQVLPSGEFYLKATGWLAGRWAFFDVRLDYVQEILWDTSLRPRNYRLEARGPLGFGRQRIEVDIKGVTATISRNDEIATRKAPNGAFLMFGMFSSYAIIPRLFLTSEEAEKLILPVLSIRYKRHEEPFHVTVRRLAPAQAQIGGERFELERYSLRLRNLRVLVLVRGEELLAVQTLPLDAGRRALLAYRADLFPEGLDLSGAGK